MKIFISWSKNKSRCLAEETKKLIKNTLGNSVELFFSPDMYKGTCVDNVIHENLLKSERCIVCITAENFKNPWLMYEAGVVYGANHSKVQRGIVIPILFEYIPEWSSWIDKPLNRYVPIRLQGQNYNYEQGKSEVKKFLTELADELGIKVKFFERNWKQYLDSIEEIIYREQLIPDTCVDLVNRLMQDNNGNFTIVSPEITKTHILFLKGFSTNPLTRILLQEVMDYQGKRLWIWGRRNKKII